ncbi:MAG: NADP-dependent oxidoreductase [Candidatus Accumulibacter sp.]|uniref:NADP-dependent oxidoreductase n=1 Tax=Accumulibacter sp. TaxID=2053492 RepID=UPI001B0868C7|nr:NADP-dependent oxidoreductase [Accumulibacter sp.]MBO3715494.1 NADP-dependent oxidoreductase [Accumulibacter sp.]
MTRNRQILLVSRPTAEVSHDDFRLVATGIPELGDGQVLVRHHYLSLDPYMRGRMNAGESYAEPQALGEVMVGGTVGEIVASRSDRYRVGDQVVGMGGWQEYQVVDGERAGALRRVDGAAIPLSAYLGAVGMPGVTAWYGLLQLIAPQGGETIVVSAASGAVGSVVGQLARLRGCRVVGIAGGPEKCRAVVEEFGFDACIDHRQHGDTRALADAIAAACPDGVDGHFENVGGRILDAVMRRCNPFARIAICGLIAGYDGAAIPLREARLILLRRLKLQGFIVSEHMEFWPPALRELGGLVASGRLRYRESIAQGIENAPAAFIGLLHGQNFGKQLVRLI